VTLVRRDGPAASTIVRFNRDSPYFLTYLLGNGTRVDHRSLLAGLSSTADARRVLLDSLSGDSAFGEVLLTTLNRYAGVAPVARAPLYAAEDVIRFASHFLHFEADSTGRIAFTLCAKSGQLRALPLRTSVALEASVFSMLRSPIEQDSLPKTMSVVSEIIRNAPRKPSRKQVDSLESVLWDRVGTSAEFRALVLRQLTVRAPFLPFRVVAQSGGLRTGVPPN